MKRKLTTILFADAQGYSVLMATDEAATLERLNRYRAIMAGLFDRHKQLALAFDFAGDQEIKNSEDRVPSYRVRMDGRNVPDRIAQPAADGEEAQAAVGSAGFARTASQLEAVWTWLKHQPRRVRVAAGLIALFLALNLLFGGIANPWFVYPSAPLALYIFLYFRRQQKRGRISPR